MKQCVLLSEIFHALEIKKSRKAINTHDLYQSPLQRTIIVNLCRNKGQWHFTLLFASEVFAEKIAQNCVCWFLPRPLTHLGQNIMAAVFPKTFAKAFSWIKILTCWWKCHWNIFPMFQLKILQHWFRKWLSASQATSHCSNQWWLHCKGISNNGITYAG